MRAMFEDVDQRRGGSDADLGVFDRDAVQVRNRFKVHESLGGDEALFERRDQIGAAGENFGFTEMVGE